MTGHSTPSSLVEGLAQASPADRAERPEGTGVAITAPSSQGLRSQELPSQELPRGTQRDRAADVDRALKDLGERSEYSTKLIPIGALHPNSRQPREHFCEEALDSLARSIRQNGLLHPILVRRSKEQGEGFEIIAGERRWRAAKKAGLAEVPVMVRDISSAQALELALLENLQREDLSPLELAKGYRQALSDHGLSQESLARSLGKSRSQIANTIRLLNLPANVQGMIQDGPLTAGHARALLSAERPEDLARLVAEKGLSVRDTEELALDPAKRRRAKRPASSGTSRGDTVDPVLSNLLGQKVTISFRGHCGALTIRFDDLEELATLVKRLKASAEGLPAGQGQVGPVSPSPSGPASGLQAVPGDPGFQRIRPAPGQANGTASGHGSVRPLARDEAAYGPRLERAPAAARRGSSSS
jgi:ParB family chromosome partitioning protein